MSIKKDRIYEYKYYIKLYGKYPLYQHIVDDYKKRLDSIAKLTLRQSAKHWEGDSKEKNLDFFIPLKKRQKTLLTTKNKND